MHTLLRFFQSVEDINIILVLPKNEVETWQNLCNHHNFLIPHKVVFGGNSRFQSVKNGINSIEGTEGIVAIHDGVRPLVTEKDIQKTFEKASKLGNATLAVKLKDSIRIEENNHNKALDRNKFYLIQTPQTFDLKLIKRAFNTEESPNFTDDTTVLERLGENINLVEGSYSNIKITTPEDLIIAEALLNSQTITSS
jgi:2-C-methyl-D-erythritol 4-phosphate cytidylyltransferase